MVREVSMKRIQIVLLITMLFCRLPGVAQTTVTGKTNVGSFGAKPAALSASVKFSEPSGNNSLDAGETSTLQVTVVNNGGSTAKRVVAKAMLPEGIVGLKLTSPIQVGDIGPGESKNISFHLSASKDVPSRSVKIEFVVSDATGTRTGPQAIVVNVTGAIPAVLTTTMSFSESSGNNVLDAGETGSIELRIFNTGGSVAKNVVAKSVIPPGTIGLKIVPVIPVGDISPDSSTRVSFRLSAAENVPTQKVALRVEVSGDAGIQIEPQTVLVSLKERIIAPDVTPPEISLIEPSNITTRGFKPVTSGPAIITSSSSITVRGLANDSGGVAVVLVNGAETQLSQTEVGTAFVHQALLSLGANEVEIKAIDKFRNENTITILVKREENFIRGQYYALVMTVQDYGDKSMNDLEYPIKDGQSLVDILTKEYSFDKQNVVFLKNPDRRTVINEFQNLRRRLSENDNLLIFYAGHGYWDEALKQGYWLPSNASADDPSEWVSNSTVRDYIRGITTKHTLLISDACFSGGIFKTRDPFIRPDAAIQKIYETPSRRAMTSGSLRSVPDRSVFIEFLIKRLRESKDKYIYAQKLYINLKDAVINNSPNNQTPLYGVINESGDEGEGDFVFVRR